MWIPKLDHKMCFLSYWVCTGHQLKVEGSCHVVSTSNSPVERQWEWATLTGNLSASAKLSWLQSSRLWVFQMMPQTCETDITHSAGGTLNSQTIWNHGVINDHYCFKPLNSGVIWYTTNTTFSNIEMEVFLVKLRAYLYRNGKWGKVLEEIQKSKDYSVN